jgi:ABC-2 type transport system permease protein
MRNILAIAQKELRSYFASPIAYIVIGMFIFVYGYFYAVMFGFFVQAGMQSPPGGGAPALNINQDMLRPVIQNMLVVMLFVLPMITMRTYAEEKRSGTIELLLTAPLTDFEIILGKFFGAMGLYGAMLVATLPHIGILFIYGNPEWKPIVTAYLGLLLIGGCFISVGLFISSLTKNQIVAAAVTFATFLMLWVVNWLPSVNAGMSKDIADYLSIIEHLDDFNKGIIDTTHLIYYISFITFGLFLTAKSVDTERWRG